METLSLKVITLKLSTKVPFAKILVTGVPLTPPAALPVVAFVCHR